MLSVADVTVAYCRIPALTCPILSLFYCYGDHRNLHSFPTRRSSDLPAERRRPRPANWPGPRPGARSEEHTSELQSQSNLVCRLLLEKKKTDRPARDEHQVPGSERAGGADGARETPPRHRVQV